MLQSKHSIVNNRCVCIDASVKRNVTDILTQYFYCSPTQKSSPNQTKSPRGEFHSHFTKSMCNCYHYSWVSDLRKVTRQKSRSALFMRSEVEETSFFRYASKDSGRSRIRGLLARFSSLCLSLQGGLLTCWLRHSLMFRTPCTPGLAFRCTSCLYSTCDEPQSPTPLRFLQR